MDSKSQHGYSLIELVVAVVTGCRAMTGLR